MSDEGFVGRWARLKRERLGDTAPAVTRPNLDATAEAALDEAPPADAVHTDAVRANAAEGALADTAPADGTPQPSVAARHAEASSEGPDSGRRVQQASLPSIDTLTPASEYSAFMRPGVDPGLRSSALKQLFKDPRFNQMDGLDTYIDDYGRPDPIPLAFLRRMNQSRVLGLFADEEAGVAEEGASDETVAYESVAGKAVTAETVTAETVTAETVTAETVAAETVADAETGRLVEAGRAERSAMASEQIGPSGRSGLSGAADVGIEARLEPIRDGQTQPSRS